MKLRIYGNIKDTKTNQAIIDANVKLFLDKKGLQEVKSIKNGFFEIITEIDDSRIEGGQQLRVIVEKEGYQKQEHRVFTTEGSFNLDIELEPVVVPLPSTPKKSFNRLPLIIGGAVLLALLVGGMITWLLLHPSVPQIISFSLDTDSIDIGESAMLHWDTKNASTVKIEPGIGEVKPQGDIKVKPARTMEYTLTAMNEEEKFISKALTVEVVGKENPNELLDTSGTIQTKSGGLNIMGSVGIGTKSPSTELEVNGIVTAKSFSGSVNWSDIANIPPGFTEKVDNVDDADADPRNEIQTLSLEGNKITLSKGGSIIVPYAVNADKLDGKDASEFISDISGSGGTNYLAKWIGSKTLGNSVIYDNGNVGIGTTSPKKKLHISGSGLKLEGRSDGPEIEWRTTGTSRHWNIDQYGSGADLRFFTEASDDRSGVARVTFKENGDVRANNYLRNSDVRLKKNITIIENALDKVSALRGVVFEWRTEEYPEKGLDEGQEVGLIAQEVEEVLPDVVSEDNDGYKSLDYSRFSPVLIEAIKELKAEMDELREENADLKERIAVLEERY